MQHLHNWLSESTLKSSYLWRYPYHCQKYKQPFGLVAYIGLGPLVKIEKEVHHFYDIN